MATLQETLNSHYATKEELIELSKAVAQTALRQDNKAGGYPAPGTADVMITIDYDAELQKLVQHQAPFLRYLESHGCVASADSAKVGYRKKTQMTTSSFIPETGDIPDHVPAAFSDEIAKMQTLVYPIEVSDMALKGVDEIDLLADEITDGYLDIAQTKDVALLTSDGTVPYGPEFKGLFPSIETVAEDAGGVAITKDILDETAQEVIDNGGSPSAIVTTARVGRQLNDILYPTVRNVDKVELTLGNWVTGYNAPNGITVPILVDPNLPTGDGNDSLAIIDNNSLRVRELQPPTMIELAKTRLTTSRVLYTYFTFYNRAEYKNGKIENIGEE